MRLRAKLFGAVIAAEALLFGTIFAFFVTMAGASLREYGLEAGRARAQREAAVIARRLDAAAVAAADLAAAVASLKAEGRIDRITLTDLCEALVARHDEFFASRVTFTKNAWDGRDSAYARDPLYAPSGAYLPWARPS